MGIRDWLRKKMGQNSDDDKNERTKILALTSMQLERLGKKLDANDVFALDLFLTTIPKKKWDPIIEMLKNPETVEKVIKDARNVLEKLK